ncbi:phosphatidate cytidylyltransferase [Nonomuraea jiangxiensis]|uniref:Phosphatidate cytidylyltransferase n=1 Tax=Nonomuraea jiangxiensis TaxID=633440 RepID=A0A1G9SHD8_9ACTN|nr:phosphatidate cytidylyltransferase [Nonomuraea jiangxiensis]
MVGVVLGALVLGSLYTIKELFLPVVVAAVGVGVLELIKAFATRDIKVPAVPVLAGLVAMQAGAYWGGAQWMLAGFAIFALVLLVWRMFSGGTDGYVRDASASVFILFYPAMLSSFTALLLRAGDGDNRVLIFIAVTVASDIGGFIAGVLFGKHPMTRISPRKTWEGFAGSFVACTAVGAWLVVWLLGGEIWQGALIGGLAALLATMGDLIESMIKRDLGIKDLGTILPGHGGLMDRLDSLVTTLVPVWLLMTLFF